MFNTPIVIFTFKRTKNLDKYGEIFRTIHPRKVYFFSDGWRTDDEKEQVLQCRRTIEQMNFPEETIVKHVFREENYGCFREIAGGAYEVFEEEETAIFLEDDNIPDLSFFEYCEKALDYYRFNDRVFIIWGTNYLIESRTKYAGTFTRHFLPCGWASWKSKFTKYYHLNYQDYCSLENYELARKHYFYDYMYQHDRTLWDVERDHFSKSGSYLSWDFQLCFYLRLHDLVGLLPKYNLVVNNGIDADNTHGGGDVANKMLRKLCPQVSKPIDSFRFLDEIIIDKKTERQINKIRIPKYYLPIKSRLLVKLSKIKRKFVK